MKKRRCFEYIDDQEKPVFFIGEIEKLVKCPYCKSRNIIKNIIVTHVTKLDTITNKLVNYTDKRDMTGSGFDCLDCNIGIIFSGDVEFKNRYDEQ
jgi:hypothetical protein